MKLIHSWHVRKRDKEVVRIESVKKDTIDYVTFPLLMVYTTTKHQFEKNFRPATEEEIGDYRTMLP